MAKIDKFIGNLTTEETKEALVAALEQLPQEEAIAVLKDWITGNQLAGEFDGLEDKE